MNNNLIFCPSNHLLLDAATCPICGWQRPPDLPQGSLLWQPVSLNCGIGGPARETYFRPGVVNDIAVFPLRSGELVALSRQDGSVIWKSDASPELFPRQLFSNGNDLFGVVADNRSLEKAGNGYLARIDTKTGSLEKMWESFGFTMTNPVFGESLIFTRTAKPHLVALDRADLNRVIWDVPLKSYKPISPVVTDDLVLTWDGEVTREKMLLKAFQAKDGNAIWQTDIDDIDSNPVVWGDVFLYTTRKNELGAIKILNEKVLWSRTFEKIYSNICVLGDKMYIVVRDSESAEESGHYCLQCLDPRSGEYLWKNKIGFRAQEVVALPDGNLYVGMGDPRFALCSSINGEILWDYCFGEDRTQRVQTHMVIDNGICWLGTYEGTIAAFQLMKENVQSENPEELLTNAKFEEAACVFALQGDLTRAAQIYQEHLNQPKRALALYEHIKNIPGQIEVLKAMGDELSVAKILEKEGNLKEAALLYEEMQEFRKSMELYKTLGLKNDVERLRRNVSPEQKDLEELIEDKRYGDAGNVAIQLRQYQKAYDLFSEAGEKYRQQSLDALIELSNTDPEPWVWDRLSEVSRKMGLFAIQAHALEKLGNYSDSAIAYMNAAQQYEEWKPKCKEEILQYYELADRFFEQEGMIDKHLECQEKILLYKKIPRVSISGHTDNAFKEGQFNILTLKVLNNGFDVANSIDFHVLGNKFEIDKDNFPGSIKSLGVNLSVIKVFSVRPLETQIGDNVPFTLEWTWEDRHGALFRDKTTVYVTVKDEKDSRTSGTPMIIHAQNYYEKEVHLGDVIEEGGNKGDQLITGGGHTTILDAEMGDISADNLLKQCPNCHIRVDKDDKFCIKCDYKFDD